MKNRNIILFFAVLFTLLFTANISAQISGIVHIEDIGDKTFSGDVWAGTKGESRRLEGFSLRIEPAISGLSLQYMCHIQGNNDSGWMREGSFCGTRYESKRLEGIAIRLVGREAKNYNVIYQVHLEDIGDTDVCKNGEFCGTRGQSRRLEALRVTIVRR
ncbi:hypothetical protein BH10ACI1_BH10ACI1_30240 [soil metagenome]